VNAALPGHPSGCSGANACGASCPRPAAAALAPLSDEQLLEVLEHADLVLNLGAAAAPGAARALAAETERVVNELRAARRELDQAAAFLRDAVAERDLSRGSAEAERAAHETTIEQVETLSARAKKLEAEVESYRSTQKACDDRIAELKEEVAVLQRRAESLALSAASEHDLASRLERERDAAIRAAADGARPPEPMPDCPLTPEAGLVVNCAHARDPKKHPECAEAQRCHEKLRAKLPALYAGVGRPS
jgi:hypothetical protein